MSESRRIRITHVHKEDGHYGRRAKIIGLAGRFEPGPFHHYSGYYAGNFYPDGKLDSYYYFFLGIRYRRI